MQGSIIRLALDGLMTAAHLAYHYHLDQVRGDELSLQQLEFCLHQQHVLEPLACTSAQGSGCRLRV